MLNTMVAEGRRRRSYKGKSKGKICKNGKGRLANNIKNGVRHLKNVYC